MIHHDSNQTIKTAPAAGSQRVWPLILLSAHYLNVHWHRPVPGLVLGFGYGLFYAILTFRIDREIKGNGKEQSDEHPEK